MRFVMSHRRAGKFCVPEKRASRGAMALAMSQLSAGIDLLADHQPSDDLARRVTVFEADPAELQAKAARFGADVLVEPELLHYTSAAPPPGLFGAGAEAADSAVGQGQVLALRVTGGGQALAHASVSLTLRQGPPLRATLQAHSDAQGRVRFEFGPGWQAAMVWVVPYHGHWPMVLMAPAPGSTVDCPALPLDGPLGWWQRSLGQTRHRKTAGRGLRVGVVDTGCGPHPALAHATLAGAFIGGEVLPAAATLDVASHGSHVCATIGGRPSLAQQPAGLAPGARLYAARVFANADSGANQGDIANAIDALSRDHQVDLVNLSLGTPPGSPPSQIELDAILDALERGTLCICAAGNHGAPRVSYPALFEPCVAVAALGQLGVGPAGSLSAMRLPAGQPDRFGHHNLYLANFSNHGTGLDACAPGVGVVAAVPARHGLAAPVAAMDGTSMAAPVLTGLLAARLGSDRAYKALPRDIQRSGHARLVLRGLLRDAGFGFQYQGGGMPRA